MNQIFRDFLVKSQEFHQILFLNIKDIPFTPETEFRVLATLIMSDISSEHCHAIHVLAQNNCFISATSLMRLQYESLLRASWLYWVASDGIIEKIHQPLTDRNVKRLERNTPTINVMLEDLNQSLEKGIVPRKAVTLLQQFKDQALKPSNSYVHSGMHAFSRKKEGYPEPLMIQILQNSNGLEALNAMLLATMMNSVPVMNHVLQTQYLYVDCLPMHIPQIMENFYNVSIH